MTDVPGATPVTTPVPETTVATEDVPLDHVPPGVASLRVVDAPTQTVAVPVIGALALTVTGFVAIQPPIEYVMVAVPDAIPVTMPEEEPTEATDGVLLLHVPPGTEFVNVAVIPTHTLDEPLITDGLALTEMFLVT